MSVCLAAGVGSAFTSPCAGHMPPCHAATPRSGGPNAFVNIKYIVPCWQSCMLS